MKAPFQSAYVEKNNKINTSFHPQWRTPHLHIFTQSAFTLILQLCRDFFKRFICTDKYGCVRKHTENAAHKNTPLFLKEKSSCAKAMEENGNRKRKLRCRRSAFSREKKFACPLASHPFTLIELLVNI